VSELSGEWRERLTAAVKALGEPSVPAQFWGHAGNAVAAGAKLEFADDLALAWFCGRGDRSAGRLFEARLMPTVAASARNVDPAPAFVAEVQQRARIRILLPTDKAGVSNIKAYQARGPIKGWVAVAATRLALNLKRDQRRANAHTRNSDDLVELVDTAPDPATQHLRTLYQAEFRAALTAALTQLPDRARTVLRLRFVDGLGLAQLGRMYAVHEATISRWVTDAIADVSQRARQHLISALTVSPSTLESVIRLLPAGLDISVARLLAERA
jgi:RNA polymerase sigma-70 factor (ECF subfamily)